jgi:DNA-binding transcriptional LysR family regulator
MVHGVRLVRPLPEIQPRPVWLVMPPELRGLPRLRAAANAIAAELRRRLA